MSNEGNKDPSIKTLQSISSSIAAIETPLLQQMRLQLVLDALKKEATDSTKAAWYAEVQYIHHYTYNKLIETSTLKATDRQRERGRRCGLRDGPAASGVLRQHASGGSSQLGRYPRRAVQQSDR